MSWYVQACTWSHVLTQVRWQAENGPIILPSVAFQTTRVRGKTSRVGGMTASGDAAVCRALAADLLELSGGLSGRLAPASLTGGKRLLGTLRRRLSARVAEVFGLARVWLGPNGEPAADAAVRLAGVRRVRRAGYATIVSSGRRAV